MWALTLSLLLANSATAIAAPSLEAARHAHFLAQAAELERSSSPRDWAFSTRLVDSSDPAAMVDPSRGALLRKAAEAAPADRLVQWLWASMNDSYAGCTTRNPCPGRELAVARMEPDNVAGWLFVFPKESEGAAAGEEFLHRIAQLQRYDEPTIDAWIAWTDFHRAHPVPAALYPEAPVRASAEDREAWAITSGIAYGSTISVPQLALFRFCSRVRQPKAPESRFRDCDRVGELMFDQSRSVMMQMLGLALRRTAASKPDQFSPAKRVLDWRMQQFIAISADWEAKPRDFLAFYRDAVATGSEIRAQELLLARAGVSIDPPADWKSPWPER